MEMWCKNLIGRAIKTTTGKPIRGFLTLYEQGSYLLLVVYHGINISCKDLKVLFIANFL